MIVACPACQTRYEIDPSRLRGGRGRLRCARCQAVFPVGSPLARPATASATATGATAQPGPASPEPAPPARRLEVALVAMEEGPQRDALVGLLEAESVRTLTARDGAAALDTIRRSRPHLAVLAHGLAAATGPEVAAEVMADPALSRVKILLVGGPSTRAPRGASAASAQGVDAHLAEGADAATTRSTLLALLGLPDGRLAGPPPEEIARLAWLAAGDLGLYHAEVVAAARRARRKTDEVRTLIEKARRGCLERHPELRSIAGGADAFVAELELALGLRG